MRNATTTGTTTEEEVRQGTSSAPHRQETQKSTKGKVKPAPTENQAERNTSPKPDTPSTQQTLSKAQPSNWFKAFKTIRQT
jgi:hypothetical protein